LSQQQYDAVVSENQQLKAQFTPSPLVPLPRITAKPSPHKILRLPTSSSPTPSERRRLISILFATNRKINGPAVGTLSLEQITDDRSPTLAYGIHTIRVPEFHKIGKVERPYDFRVFGLSFWRAAEDEKTHFVSKGIARITKEDFLNLLRNHRDQGAM